MPVLEWHFGDTRSGKTTAALAIVGGKDNPDCYYHKGTIDWIGHYSGESIMLLNEYRASSKDAFCTLLSILEGFPADVQIKGGFSPIRVKTIIITCPRPPKALDVSLFGFWHHFDGEFASKDKYSINHELTAWEDVDQVVERIRESGGKIVCHGRQHPLIDGVRDESKYEYTHVTVLGAEHDTQSPIENDMDAMLNAV